MAKSIEEPKYSPKEARALKYLQKHAGLTSDQAREKLGDARLSDTILKLRRKGFDIDCVRVDITNRWGEPTWYGKYVLRNK